MNYFTCIRRFGDIDYLECMEYTRQRFGKRDHDNIVSALTYWAAQGCEFKHLLADVFVSNNDMSAWFGPRVLRYETKTVVDGSTIDMKLYLNGIFLRKINIAC